MDRRAIETEATTVELDGHIVCVRTKGVPSTPEFVEAGVAAIHRLTGGRSVPVLFDARHWPGGTVQSWMAVISSVASAATAVAVLIDAERQPDLIARAASIDRLLLPFRLFSGEADAREFLAAYVKTPDSD